METIQYIRNQHLYKSQDGDPSKPYTLRFDDKNVHYLMAGATGAGKSVAIDCAMQSMLHEYAPDSRY